MYQSLTIVALVGATHAIASASKENANKGMDNPSPQTRMGTESTETNDMQGTTTSESTNSESTNNDDQGKTKKTKPSNVRNSGANSTVKQ